MGFYSFIPKSVAAMRGAILDPFGSYNFLVFIQDVIAAGFTKVSGLSMETEVEVIEEGGVNNYVHRLPKRTKYSDLTLERGLMDQELWNWYRDVISEKPIERKNVSIILLNRMRIPMMCWNFADAYPIKWEGPGLDASTNQIATERIVLTHHGLVVK